MMWQIAGKTVNSRLLLGTARYPSLQILTDAVHSSGAEILTISLRRQLTNPNASMDFWNAIKALNCHLLPNTAGCMSAKEAIVTAQMAREVFDTNWLKLEVIYDDYTLQPDPFELVIAAKELIEQGFEVFPYCTDDLVLCERLVHLGCRIIMPWAAPIGSGKGIIRPEALLTLRDRLKNITLIVDAGIGAPSHAAKAMELGFDGVLLNSAVALAANPVEMAASFAKAIDAGYNAYHAGIIPAHDFASASTPILGKPFWQQS
jgi:thiazole synthase